jgi:hypothetical protein
MGSFHEYIFFSVSSVVASCKPDIFSFVLFYLPPGWPAGWSIGVAFQTEQILRNSI